MAGTQERQQVWWFLKGIWLIPESPSHPATSAATQSSITENTNTTK